MRICYVDESGTTGTIPSATSPVDPLFVIAGFAVEQSRLHALTMEFLDIKERFFKGLVVGAAHHLDKIRAEVKGSTVRGFLRRKGRRGQRLAVRFFDAVLALLERHEARIMGRVWIRDWRAPERPSGLYVLNPVDMRHVSKPSTGGG